MKTLIVTNSLSGGGAESSMRLINNHLHRSGADSTLLALNKTEGSRTGAAEIELGRKWKSGPVQTMSNFIDFYRIVTRTLRRICSDQNHEVNLRRAHNATLGRS